MLCELVQTIVVFKILEIRLRDTTKAVWENVWNLTDAASWPN